MNSIAIFQYQRLSTPAMDWVAQVAQTLANQDIRIAWEWDIRMLIWVYILDIYWICLEISWGYRVLILGILDERHIPVDIESVLGYDVHQQLPHNPVVYHHCPYSNNHIGIFGETMLTKYGEILIFNHGNVNPTWRFNHHKLGVSEVRYDIIYNYNWYTIKKFAWLLQTTGSVPNVPRGYSLKLP